MAEPLRHVNKFNEVGAAVRTMGKRNIPASCVSVGAATLDTEGRHYTLQTVTPMFGGGVEAGQPDEQMPIRPSAMRGQLRFWWRCLHREQFCTKKGALDVVAMRAREAEVWGNTEQPSAVEMLVDAQRLEETDYRAGDKFGFQPFSPEAYALFPAIENDEVERIVREEYQFKLHIRWPKIDELNRRRSLDNQRRARSRKPLLDETIKDVTDEIEITVATWIALGGLGARTRRGLGTVKLIEASHPLPPVRLPAGARLFVSPRATSDSMFAWRQAVDVFRRFRQSFRGAEHRKPGNPRPVPGRSHWPEPDSIRMLTGCALDDGDAPPDGTPADQNPHQHTTPVVDQSEANFPRAVLGLPIGFHFAGDGPGQRNPATPKKDPASVELVPHATGDDDALCFEKDESGNSVAVAGDRMASPIITKPVYLDGEWLGAVIVLPCEHALNVNAVLKGKMARWNSEKGHAEDLQEAVPNSQILGNHLGSLCAESITDPMRGHSNAIDALIAFLRQKEDGANPPAGKPVFQERTLP